MRRYVSIGTSLSLILGGISTCWSTSLAENINGYNSFIKNSINNQAQEDVVYEEDLEEGDRFPFVPDRAISFNEAISEISDLLEKYKESKDIKTLKECVLTFGEIPKISKSLTNNTVKNSTKLKELFNDIRFECYNLEEIENQEKYVKLFAEEIFLGWKYDKKIEYFKDEFLIKGLIDYNKNRLLNIQDRLNYLLFVIDFYNELGDPFPEYNFIPQIDEQVYPDVNPDDEVVEDDNSFYDDMIDATPEEDKKPPFSEGNSNDNIQESIEPEDVSTLTTSYKKIGKDCYKVVEEIKGGKVIKTDKTLVDKSEYVYCGIYDYVDFGEGYASGHVIIDEDYINNNQNELSDYFVYYTVTKNEKAPYYYNTGMKADDISKTISYNQLRDAFYHLAIKNKSFNIDDNEKSLYIFDGKPLVIKKTIDDNYNQKDIDRLLKNFKNLGVKIMKNEEYKICQTKYEEAQAEKNVTYINNIMVDGTTIHEDKIAWVEGDVLKTSIQTIAELLLAKTEAKDGYLSIEKNGNKILIYEDKNKYSVNDEDKYFITNAYKKNGKYVSELADIPTLLGYNAEFDSDNNSLIFTKIK